MGWKVGEALDYLVILINQGKEFADAQFYATMKYKLSTCEVTELVNLYDQRGY